MKLDFIELNEKFVDIGLNQLSDSLKVLLYEYNPEIFDNFYFDALYVEPSLFYQFFKSNNDAVEQYLLKNYIDNERALPLKLQYDLFGYSQVPGFGVIENVTNKPAIFQNGSFIDIDGKNLELKPEIKIYNSDISICNFVPDVLNQYVNDISFNSVQATIQSNIPALENAWDRICTYSPDFASAINRTTKEISISNFPKMPSFASLNYFGTTFINIHNQIPSEIFYIDEIAHQCGHTLFYLYTLDPNDYFKYSFDTPLKNFTGISYETREIYGCLHSMFTLCTIIHSLHNCLSKGKFEKSIEVEFIARIGFYLNKLLYDINNLSGCDIFSKKGFVYYEMFRLNSEYYSKLYNGLFVNLSFNEQKYLFDIDVFFAENKNFINEKNIFV